MKQKREFREKNKTYDRLVLRKHSFQATNPFFWVGGEGLNGFLGRPKEFEPRPLKAP